MKFPFGSREPIPGRGWRDDDLASESKQETNMKSGAMRRQASHSAQPRLVELNVTDPITADRAEWIASRAYFKAAGRGFEPGHEIEDWLEAETEYGQKGGH